MTIPFRLLDLFSSDHRWISAVKDGYTISIGKFLGGLVRQGLSKVEDSVPSGTCLLLRAHSAGEVAELSANGQGQSKH